MVLNWVNGVERGDPERGGLLDQLETELALVLRSSPSIAVGQLGLHRADPLLGAGVCIAGRGARGVGVGAA